MTRGVWPCCRAGAAATPAAATATAATITWNLRMPASSPKPIVPITHHPSPITASQSYYLTRIPVIRPPGPTAHPVREDANATAQ